MTTFSTAGDRGAAISDCGRYRYLLWRVWDAKEPVLGWIMLNPSTADADTDDHTIRRCVGFAKRDGYGGIRVANLFPWRATYQRDLRAAAAHAVDRDGNDPTDWLISECDHIVAAWGAVHRTHRQRVREVLAMSSGWPLLCLGVTKNGDPRHPARVSRDQPLLPFGAVDGDAA